MTQMKSEKGSSWDNSNKFPKIDYTVIRYEVCFQEWPSTDTFLTCKHAHEFIKHAVACLYRSAQRLGANQPRHYTVFAVSGGYYRGLTPEEEYRVAEASRRFIV